MDKKYTPDADKLLDKEVLAFPFDVTNSIFLSLLVQNKTEQKQFHACNTRHVALI
jgi:hypothetical protein